MAAILCLRRGDGGGLGTGRWRGPAGVGTGGGLSRTDSSSFSMPVGICGTARLIEAYSARSGKSSQRKTGSGLDASSARARNDSLLMLVVGGCNCYGGCCCSGKGGGGSESAPS